MPWKREMCREDEPESAAEGEPQLLVCHMVAGSSSTPARVERFALYHYVVRSREDWSFFHNVNRYVHDALKRPHHLSPPCPRAASFDALVPVPAPILLQRSLLWCSAFYGRSAVHSPCHTGCMCACQWVHSVHSMCCSPHFFFFFFSAIRSQSTLNSMFCVDCDRMLFCRSSHVQPHCDGSLVV
jgi:hypothetical protein